MKERSQLAKRICNRHYNGIGSIPPLPLWQVIDEEAAALVADNEALAGALRIVRNLASDDDPVLASFPQSRLLEIKAATDAALAAHKAKRGK